MNLQDALQSTIHAAASSPKVATAVSTATATLGAASFADLIQGPLSCLAIIAGVIATFLLGRVHWMTGKNRDLENKILRKQAQDLGIDLTKD